MLEVLEFLFRDFTTWGGFTIWLLIVGICCIEIASAFSKWKK